MKDTDIQDALLWFVRPWTASVDDFEGEVVIGDAQGDTVARWENTPMNWRLARLITDAINALPPVDDE